MAVRGEEIGEACWWWEKWGTREEDVGVRNRRGSSEGRFMRLLSAEGGGLGLGRMIL
jgi:hypothetical protein